MKKYITKKNQKKLKWEISFKITKSRGGELKEKKK